MSYQVLGLRSYQKWNATEKKYETALKDTFHEKRWRFEKLEEMFADPVGLLDKLGVPVEERFNLFYTINYCGTDKREFARREALFFDIDGIDVNKLEQYESVVWGALGVSSTDATVVFSGNGLHFIFLLPESEHSTDASYFTENRLQYRGVLKLIDRILEEKRLPGTPDFAVFDARRILRFPGTRNVKPGKPERTAVVRQCSTSKRSFDLEKLSGIKKLGLNDEIPIKRYAKYRNPDGVAALEKCLFLKHCKDNPASISEPEWYAAASIVARFNDGPAKFHEISKGHPKYSVKDTDDKIEQSLKASGPRTCKNIDALWGECANCPLHQKIPSPVVIFGDNVIPSEATGFHDIIITKQGDKYIPNFNELLQAFERDHKYKAISDMKAVYVYTGTHYEELGPWDIKGYSERMFEPKPKESLRAEFYAKVLVNNLDRRQFFIDSTEGHLNFKNGVLNLKASILEAHRPEFGFRTVLPYDFDPEARCPEWLHFVNEIMCDDASLVALLQEFVGYIVYGGEYKFNKALWLSGTGSNGKSTFINTLMDLVGRGAYSNLPIKQIINDKFASSELDGKFVNFSEETSPEDLSDSGPFKNLTGDGMVMAQKKYGDPYSFYNRAKLVMSYNEIPILKDLSHGMLRRIIVIPFNFTVTDAKKMRTDLRDVFKSELSGIFNWAMEGYKRLYANNGFSFSQASADALNVVKEESDNVTQWINENVEIGVANGKEYTTATLYDIYKDCLGRYAYNKNKFAKRLTAVTKLTPYYKRTTSFRGYHGIIVNGKGTALDNSVSADF